MDGELEQSTNKKDVKYVSRKRAMRNEKERKERGGSKEPFKNNRLKTK